VLQSHQIRQFYLREFDVCGDISKKQVIIRTSSQRFIPLNKLRHRLNHRSLRRFLIHYAPINVYASIIDWLMPERVSEKSKANQAYPFRGDYAVDVDVPQLWRPWNGFNTNNIYAPGLQIAYDRTIAILDKIRENYSDIQIVFSGKRGFHIHVRDFNLRDWTHYDTSNPIKSHEVARYIYTLNLQSALGEFNKYHIWLSTDPMRVLTIPNTLNGKTGLICFDVGTPRDFENLTLEKLVRKSDARRYFYDNGFKTGTELIHSHPETIGGGR